MKPTYLYTILFSTALIVGCKKNIEVGAPVNNTNAANVYATDVTAAAVLTGIYSTISANSFSTSPAFNSLSNFLSLSADEVVLYPSVSNSISKAYYMNALSTSVAGSEFWNNTYPILYYINAAIEGLNGSNTLTPAVKTQLLGEAKFLRAFSYFYLLNLYKEVPLVVSTRAEVNATLSRAATADVWQQIVADLKDAQNLLTSGYVAANATTSTNERTRPNKWAATALLAKTYLYTGKYDSAEIQATSIIGNTALYDTIPLKDTFLKNSKEAIWQIQPVGTGTNTPDARYFILPASGPSNTNPIYLSQALINSFEPGDLRFINWVGSVTANSKTYYFPYKYKVALVNQPVTEYTTVFRVAEQYIIRAEARAKQNNLSNAISDLNTIRNRAGLINTSAMTQSDILSAIQQERRVELFTEWGNRWFDLKRWSIIDNIMTVATAQKGGTWKTTSQFFPLPLVDIQRDPNLVQNPGY